MIKSIKSKVAKIIIATMCLGIVGVMPTTAFAQEVTTTNTVSSVIKVTGMRIDSDYWDRETGTSKYIATVYPANATNKNVVWTSSNPNVIKIDNAGTAVLVGKGTAVLTCKATDGSGVTKKVDITNDYLPQK